MTWAHVVGVTVAIAASITVMSLLDYAFDKCWQRKLRKNGLKEDDS